MRTRAGVTAGVAVLSVLSGALGHSVLAGHPVPGAALPRLGLLAALCFLLASQRLAHPALVAALSLIQVAVHVTLMHTPVLDPVVSPMDEHAAHTGHDMASMPMPMPMEMTAHEAGIDVPMVALHLAAMLGTLALLHGAAVWWERLVVALARVLPRLPRPVLVASGSPAPAAYAVLPTPCPQRWLPATVRRRGPPVS